MDSFLSLFYKTQVCFFVTGDFLQHLGEKGVCQDKAGVWSSYSECVLVVVPLFYFGRVDFFYLYIFLFFYF